MADSGIHIASKGGCAMRTYDFTPLFRHSIGFDHFQRLFDNAVHFDQTSSNSYPPYNIERVGEDNYQISMAVAGFSEADLDIIATEDNLTVAGEIKSNTDKQYLHRGIAGRSFERNFSLAEYVKVIDAHIDNGLLYIDLVREVPESQKPRKIEIKAKSNRSIKERATKFISGKNQTAA